MKDSRYIPEKDIRTVDQLVAALHAGPGESGYLSVLDRISIPADSFDAFCTWNSKRYTRNCIARSENFELLLICYEPGQSTSIHDYDTEEAWVHPIKGSIIEERFQEAGPKGLRKISSSKLDTGSFSYLHNGRGIHRYINHTDDRAITLNLYAKPLSKWKVYDERSGEGRSAASGT